MSEYKIADGHDNAAGLTEWHDFEAQAWAGDRSLVPVGLAWVAWCFFRLTRDEMAHLRANFGAAVTIRTLDKSANAFRNFNATLVLPDAAMGWEADGWNEVRVEFRDLVGI